MFGTLRCDTQRNGSEFTERPNGSLLGDSGVHVPQRSACDKCRSKKVRLPVRRQLLRFMANHCEQLRCSGQKSGCDRCKATATSCVYTETVDGRVSKRRKRPDARVLENVATSQPRPAPSPQLNSTSVPTAQPTKAAGWQQMGTPPSQENDPSQHHQDSDPAVSDLLEGLGSPMSSFEEDYMISDQMLRDILPDCGSQRMESYNMTTPDYTFHTGADMDGYFHFGPTTMDRNSVSSDHTQGTLTCTNHYESMNIG